MPEDPASSDSSPETPPLPSGQAAGPGAAAMGLRPTVTVELPFGATRLTNIQMSGRKLILTLEADLDPDALRLQSPMAPGMASPPPSFTGSGLAAIAPQTPPPTVLPEPSPPLDPAPRAADAPIAPSPAIAGTMAPEPNEIPSAACPEPSPPPDPIPRAADAPIAPSPAIAGTMAPEPNEIPSPSIDDPRTGEPQPEVEFTLWEIAEPASGGHPTEADAEAAAEAATEGAPADPPPALPSEPADRFDVLPDPPPPSSWERAEPASGSQSGMADSAATVYLPVREGVLPDVSDFPDFPDNPAGAEASAPLPRVAEARPDSAQWPAADAFRKAGHDPDRPSGPEDVSIGRAPPGADGGSEDAFIRYTCPRCHEQGILPARCVGTLAHCHQCGKPMRLVLQDVGHV